MGNTNMSLVGENKIGLYNDSNFTLDFWKEWYIVAQKVS
jgi:hypothetical protein